MRRIATFCVTVFRSLITYKCYIAVITKWIYWMGWLLNGFILLDTIFRVKIRRLKIFMQRFGYYSTSSTTMFFLDYMIISRLSIFSYILTRSNDLLQSMISHYVSNLLYLQSSWPVRNIFQHRESFLDCLQLRYFLLIHYLKTDKSEVGKIYCFNLALLLRRCC